MQAICRRHRCELIAKRNRTPVFVADDARLNK